MEKQAPQVLIGCPHKGAWSYGSQLLLDSGRAWSQAPLSIRTVAPPILIGIDQKLPSTEDPYAQIGQEGSTRDASQSRGREEIDKPNKKTRRFRNRRDGK